MFLCVVIQVFAATCFTALEIDVSDKQSAWERSGKFEGDMMLTEEQWNNIFNNTTYPWPNNRELFVKNDMFNVGVKHSAWERSVKFEGDIMLTGEQLRNGMVHHRYRWPNREVQFVIDNVFNDQERDMILRAIEDFHNKTTIRFKQYDPLTVRHYINIKGEDDGCWSNVGYLGQRQVLNLQRNVCFSHGTIIHELLHALGFFHQHSATDRDDYVTIIEDNILKGKEDNFKKYDASTITSFGVPYDYNSVMHYGEYAFTKRKELPTIVPKDPNARIGQRDGFSPSDIQKVRNMYPDVSEKQSAWEQSGKFEGDIMLTDEQMRNGLIKPARRWPSKEVPFLIDNVFNGYEEEQIRLVIFSYNLDTTIHFKKYNPLTDTDYIHITGKDDGCWSYVGYIGGRQQLNLQPGKCTSKGTIIHELLHALGFWHQHSATDRNKYVKINWKNIQPGAAGNFSKYNANTITSFGVPYDYDSVMHYGPFAFSRNGSKTIEPKDPNATIGLRDGLSAKDIEKLAKMYEDSFIDLFFRNFHYAMAFIIRILS